MPRPSSYPTPLLALVQSTSYPPVPAVDELESLRRTLNEHRQLKRKRERERDDSQIVVEARSSPIRVPKQERSVSPIGSIVAIAPSNSQPITYAGLKKKKKRPLESDDECESGCCFGVTFGTVLMISTKCRITSSASYDIYLWAQAETQQG
jgi:hypothetical protein